ncbi:MAG: extracellular solute-binding protein [bacterium]
MKYVLTILILLLALNSWAATTIEWWQFWTDPAIKPTIQEIINDFEKANPEIKVNLTDLTWDNGYEKIVLAFSSGTGPDVVELGSDWIAQFAANGQLADISNDITEDSTNFQGWGMSDYKNKIYGFPWILGTRIIYGNRNLLKQTQFGENFIPITFDQFRIATYKISKISDKVYGWGSNIAEKHRLYKKFLPFFWSYGGQIFSDDGKYCVLSSLQGVEAMEYYKFLHDSCSFVGSQREIEDAFLDGKIGFIMSGDWLLKRIELEKRDINLLSTLVPGRAFPGRSFMGGEFLSVNEASDNKDAALKFIKFITSPENQVKFCKANRSANPSSLAAQEDEYFKSNVHLQTFIKQITLSKNPPVDPDWVYIEEILENAVEDVLFNGGLPGETLREARSKISKLRK